MASRNQIRGIKGLSRLRKKLRNIEKVTGENAIRPVLEKASGEMAQVMRFLTPVDTGLAVAQIDHKVGRDGLSAKIGIRTKARAKKAFYWKFLDAGTKGNPAKGIPPMPALHIRDRAFDSGRDDLKKDLAKKINETLMKVARG